MKVHPARHRWVRMMEAYLAHVSESTIEARGCRPPDPITANHQSNSFSVPPLPQNCLSVRFYDIQRRARGCSDTIELDYEMLCLTLGEGQMEPRMAWAESCAVKECEDRKWGPHSQRAQQASRPHPDLDRWTSAQCLRTTTKLSE